MSDEAAAWAVKVYVESRDHYLAGDDPAIVSGAYLDDARSAVQEYLARLGEWDESYEAENEARLSRHMPAQSA